MSRSGRTWLELLLDGEAPDWAALEKELGPESPELARARRTAQLCMALADSRPQFPERAPDHHPDQSMTFRWGHLLVREQIGHGSSGTVYRAFDTVLERDVALKLLDDKSIRARAFIAEARRLAQVRHVNVLAVYGAAVHDGRAGLWSDLIDGLSLDQWIEANGPKPAAQVLDLAQSLASALEAVHAAGLVHGDVKPGNILRETGSNRIVLMDFGSAGDHEFAARHGLLGSPASMAPEQKSGGSIGPAADIYGLGVVLFHAANGRYPSAADSDEGSGSATVIGRLALPRALRRLMREMLARAPQDRPVAPSVLHRLERIASAPQRRRRQAGWATVIGALAVGMGISLWQANNAREQAMLAKAETDRAEQQASRAEATKNFLVSAFRRININFLPEGANYSLADFVIATEARLDSELADAPESRAELRPMLGAALHELGRMNEAHSALRNADLELQAVYSEPTAALAEALHVLVYSSISRGEFLAALDYADRSLAVIDGLPGDRGMARSSAVATVATASAELGRYHDALKLRLETMEQQQILRPGYFHGNQPRNHARVCNAYFNLARYDLAEENCRASMQMLEADEHAPPVPFARVARAYGSVLLAMGRLDEAAGQFARAIAVIEQYLGPEHPLAVEVLHNQWRLQMMNGIGPDMALLDRADAIIETTELEQLRGQALALRGRALAEHGLLDEAQALYEEALALAAGNGTSNTVTMLRATREFSQLHQRQGRNEQAIKLLLELMSRFEASQLTEHDEYGLTLLAKSAVLRAMGEYAAAARAEEMGMTVLQSTLGESFALTVAQLAGVQ